MQGGGEDQEEMQDGEDAGEVLAVKSEDVAENGAENGAEDGEDGAEDAEDFAAGVFIVGTPGVGKSVFLDYALHRLGPPGYFESRGVVLCVCAAYIMWNSHKQGIGFL